MGPAQNNGGVRITISRWFTPKHNSVHPDGVQPDIAVDVPAGTPPEKDLYLERAVQFLATAAIGQPHPSASPAAAVPSSRATSYDPRA